MSANVSSLARRADQPETPPKRPHDAPTTPPRNRSIGARVYYPAASAGPNPSAAYWLPASQYSSALPRYALHFRPPTALTSLLRVVAEGCFYVLSLVERKEGQHYAAPPAAPADVGMRPVAIFSHGASGNRTMYSEMAGEIAARSGAVVVALEHLDGSASVAREPTTSQSEGEKSADATDSAHNGPLVRPAPADALSRARWRWFEGLGGDEGCREKQETRVRELRAAARAVAALAAGEAGRDPSDPGGPGHGVVLRAHGGDAAVEALAALGPSLDVSRCAVVGHSLGGVSALAASRQSSTDDIAAQGGLAFLAAVAHDPWLTCLPRDLPPPTLPTLILASEGWHRRARENPLYGYNATRLHETFAAHRSSETGGALFAAVAGASHVCFSDVSVRVHRSPLVKRAAALMGQSGGPSQAGAEPEPEGVARAVQGATLAFLNRCWRDAPSTATTEAGLDAVVAALEGRAIDPVLHAAGDVVVTRPTEDRGALTVGAPTVQTIVS